jgi:hypothetical protein
MKKETTLSQRRKALKQRGFLESFRLTGTLTDGARAAGMARPTVYYWKRTSSLFVDRMMKALDHFEKAGDGYRLASICTLAQAGDRDMQRYIRLNHGPRILEKVMSGMLLTAKGIKT